MSFTEQDIQEFKAEAMDLLDVAEKSLLSLDKGADFKPAYDAVFRCFHNLKGAAGMMELHRLAEHTHELEERLIKFKNADGIPKAYISLFLRGIDAARALLNNQSVQFDFQVREEAPPAAKNEVSVEALTEFFAECEEIVERLAQTLQKIESSGAGKASVDSLYRDIHSLKGSSYLFSFKRLGDLAHTMETALEPFREGEKTPSKDLMNGFFRGLKLIESLVSVAKSGLSDDDFAPVIQAFTNSLTSAESQSAMGVTSPSVAVTTASVEGEGASSIRVSVALLDNLMTLMGEMVLVRNQVLQFSNNSSDLELLSMSKRLNIVTSEIQGEMMKTRMQPIGNVLNKFNRVVRDLSQELNKSIHLTLAGVEIELDKSLLESIKDPLTHIVRNSCDHGIEMPADRRRAGKPELGTISIRAYHEGGQVIVDIADDGKGLHREVLLKKAIERGLINPAQGDKLPEKEIFNLIFAPGFSTASAITNVSGRGVGMDVVRTNIEKIGGTVDLASEPGRGTTIKLRIPLTLAIVPALMVTCEGGQYAIPQVKLEELVRIDQSSDSVKIEILHGAPVYRLRGNILPLIDLQEILTRAPRRTFREGIFNVAVVNTGQSVYGLIVDEVKDTADIVVKPLNRLLKSLQVYSGATILGDGSVSLILDVAGIARVAQIGQQKERSRESVTVAGATSARSFESQEYLMVQLNSPTKHAIVLGLVHRLEEFHRHQVEDSGGQPVIRYRDTILPLLSASELLGYSQKSRASSETISVVVIKRAGALYGLEVEGIVDTLNSAAELVGHPRKLRGVFGCMDVGTELVVVIDPFELISMAFPATQVESQSPPASRPTPPTPQLSAKVPRGRVLVAEDTLFFKKAIKKALESQGFEVVTANDGQEAFEILIRSEDVFDLVVSDIEMPRMDGFQFATKVRQNERFARVPMLALSSRLDQDYVQQGYRVGFDVYLEKLKPDVLIAAVEELLKKHRGAA